MKVKAENGKLKGEIGKVKGENLCKRVSENLFSIATSAAKFQSHVMWLKLVQASKT